MFKKCYITDVDLSCAFHTKYIFQFIKHKFRKYNLHVGCWTPWIVNKWVNPSGGSKGPPLLWIFFQKFKVWAVMDHSKIMKCKTKIFQQMLKQFTAKYWNKQRFTRFYISILLEGSWTHNIYSLKYYIVIAFFWQYCTIFNYEILVYFGLSWACASYMTLEISYGDI